MNDNFLNLESTLILFGLTIFIFGSIALGYFIFNLIFRSRKNNDENKSKAPSAFWQRVKVIAILFMILSGLIFCALGVFIHSLIPVTDKILVAEVYCTDVNTNDNTIDLFFVQKFGDSGNTSRSYFIIGEQWLVQGELIHWNHLAGSIGLKTNCRLVRIGGHFVNQDIGDGIIPSRYSLLSLEKNSVWQWLYRLGSHLPLIDRIDQTFAYGIPMPNTKYLIYATPTEISTEIEIP
ncbi:MAG: hypothetical protein ACOY90_17225 [Candidatus Zhuqueibacterota bacterium]